MAEGRSNQAICERLFLSPKTVETLVSSIFAKLGLLPATDDHRRVLAVLDHQPTTPPGDVLHDRERGVSVGVPEPLGLSLLALADPSAVNDQVVIVRHPVDSYGTERVLLESHIAY